MEYWSLVTPTASVTLTVAVTGPAVVNQLLLPVDIDGAAGGLPPRCNGAFGVNATSSAGGVVSVPCADAVEATTSAAPTAAAVASMRCKLSPLLGPLYSTGLPTKQQAGRSCQPQRTPSSTSTSNWSRRSL